MLIVLSPAKTLDYSSTWSVAEPTLPQLLDQSQLLIERCRELSPQDLSQLMKISDKLAGLNVARFAEWSPVFNQENSKPAVLAFKGDVYTGLEADQLDAQQLEFAQKHLRILSGLYGLLRPLDMMQPYRLEMGTRLSNERGKDLYQFWGDRITDAVNTSLQQQGDDLLINLASNEYFKAVSKRHLQGQIITPVFKDCKNGQFKVISFYAKKARGMMARYIIENQLTELQQLKAFDSAGYYFSEQESTLTELVFKRDELS